MAAEEAYHEILCAVIQSKRHDHQGLTEATLHSVPLPTIDRSNLPPLMTQLLTDGEPRFIVDPFLLDGEITG